MGSPLSVTAANVVMEEIEKKILIEKPYEIKFHYRYVDDTLICLPEKKVKNILCRFNSIDKKLKFTLETAINNNINFLDLNIQIINNKIQTNWYRKPIWSGRYINFFSNHSLSHKLSIIYSLTDRVILLSNKSLHISNLNCVRSTLLKTGYPLELLNEKYIGQTCCFLHNRLLEDAGSVINKENKTALAEHAITYKHSFDLKNIKILDFENNLEKRLILEMIHIQKENSSINYITYIENLSAIYCNIIKCIKK